MKRAPRNNIYNINVNYLYNVDEVFYKRSDYHE